MEPLPDFGTLSDDDLKSLIEELEQEENEISYRRRHAAGEDRHPARRASRAAEGEGVSDVDVEQLTDILSARAHRQRRRVNA